MSDHEQHDGQRKVTTTDAGIPAASDDHSLTVGPTGPTVLHDAYVVQKMQQFNRERVPERVVHAKGSGAHGFFEVTEDVTQWTSAAFLSRVGKRTLMSDRGTPRTWRNMNGYSSHTYSWMNAKGERFWVKYHFKTVQGIENFTLAEADAMVSEDPDYHRRDLWNSIASGNAPEWRLEMQIMPFEEAADYRFNPFDLTKVWPHADYPPITIGRMVLDRNPANHFAEVEQAGFAPARLVPGIGLSPDKMLMGRVFSYHDTHLHRIGANYEQLPINAPRCPVHSYSRDGAMSYNIPGDQPVYSPNSYGGPVADPSSEPPTWQVEAGELGRYAYEKHADDDDFVQPRALYQEVMDDTDREHLASNIIGHASDGVSDDVQRRVIGYWTNVDPDLGARVAAGLGHADGRGNGAA